MKKYLIILLVFLPFLKGKLFAQEQFMVVNPTGHRGHIHDLAVSNDGQFVISAGFDKTIKKWSLAEGEVVMEYRSKIGVGSEGMVYWVELSPDNKLLATGGWFGADDESEDVGDIRIFDYQSGRMVQVLKGLGSSPVNVHFTPDNKHIIAGDAYNKIYMWDISTGMIMNTFDYHKADRGEMLIDHAFQDHILWSVDQVGNMVFWDINKAKKPFKVDKKSIPEVYALGFNELSEATNLTIAPNLKDYALSIENFIVVFNEKQEFYALIDHKFKPGFLKFSPDGKRLLAGCSSRGDNFHSIIYEKNARNEWEAISDFNKAEASITAGAFIDENTVVTAGGMNNYLYVWSTEKAADGFAKVNQTLKTNGLCPWAAGINNEGVIAFASAWSANFGYSDFTDEFDLFLKSMLPYSKGNFHRPDSLSGKWSIKWARAGLGQTGATQGLKISEGGKAKDTIFRTFTNGMRHEVYTFTSKGLILTGGEHGFLEIYDHEGFLLNRLVGHSGLLTGLGFSDDQSRLVSSADDNTLRLWSTDKFGLSNEELPRSVRDFIDSQSKYKNIQDYLNDIIKRNGWQNDALLKTTGAWHKIMQAIRQDGVESLYQLMKDELNEMRCMYIYPIVSIFLSQDKEWIIWNEAGYFTASKKGAKYVGYHLNKGKNKEAVFYPFEQFDLKFNRPDLILKDLGLGSEKIRNFYYQAYLKRLSKMGMTEAQLSAEIAVPELSIVSSSVSTDRKTVKLQLQASDQGSGLDRINVYINDVPVFGKAGLSAGGQKTLNRELSLDLANDRNKIQISVLNKKGAESLKENLYILNPKSSELPNLYLVTIGTSSYLDKRFNLKYAAKDANDMVAQLTAGQQFGSVLHQTLTDQQSTRENILKLKEFISKAGRNDLVMVFLAGHGLLDEKLDYYYATYDVDFNDPAKRGLLYSEIEELMDGISALKKLLFMDTCHSGEVDKEDIEKSNEEKKVIEDVQFRNAGQGVRKKQGEGLASTSELVKELFTDLRRGTGATVIASAGGVEFAMESEKWKNGLFTFCLLNGLSSMAADLNQDGTILLSELQTYLSTEVNKRSGGKQQPTARQENLSLDYPVWRK